MVTGCKQLCERRAEKIQERGSKTQAHGFNRKSMQFGTVFST